MGIDFPRRVGKVTCLSSFGLGPRGSFGCGNKWLHVRLVEAADHCAENGLTTRSTTSGVPRILDVSFVERGT